MREYDLSEARWRKSTYSDGNGGNCVEVTHDFPGVVPVRDSKAAAGPVLVVGAAAWTEFVGAVAADAGSHRGGVAHA
ncbi:DUF397 domain-containing protein [Streptomyces prasinopilosus]|uniref:DUF397 domain-containing protein n=1 Tax=Streptomyces prasinopilosus TaxID=67344 RepID=A0A1G6J1H0_9ACTN|nr:DUF397 domain-containing protein [Streptomyces prasinopilosus]SDC12571.1 protein of unknown function [Streptomyces prasinopilosus]